MLHNWAVIGDLLVLLAADSWFPAEKVIEVPIAWCCTRLNSARMFGE